MRSPAAGRCGELRPKGLSSRPAKGTRGSPVKPGMTGGWMPERAGYDEGHRRVGRGNGKLVFGGEHRDDAVDDRIDLGGGCDGVVGHYREYNGVRF